LSGKIVGENIKTKVTMSPNRSMGYCGGRQKHITQKNMK